MMKIRDILHSQEPSSGEPTSGDPTSGVGEGIRAWRVTLVAVVAAVLGAGLASAEINGEISWTLFADGCAPSAEHVFACGSRGTYILGAATGAPKAAGTSCAPLAQGSEVPVVYPGAQLAPVGAAGESLTPCGDGSCFEPAPGSAPWVAVVDWTDGWHGRAVGSAIGELAGPGTDIVLFGLGESASPVASDLQVLEQLCGVLEAAEASPPRVVNMSFGRPLDPAATCPSSGPTLGCEISAVLTDLSNVGSLLVAAAGNHGTMLFPASHEDVIGVGALDVAWLRHAGEVASSWQTPAGADGLMPGTALCLPDGDGGYWSPPPGSSFAAATLSGWLAGSGVAVADPSAVGWRPLRVGPLLDPDYRLANDQGAFAGSELETITDLMSSVLVGPPSGCLPSATPSPLGLRSVHVAPVTTPYATPLVELNSAANQPTPDPDPCLPCSGGWVEDPEDGNVIAPRGAATKAVGSQIPLVVSFETSPGVPASLELVDLYFLRHRGEQYFALQLTAFERSLLLFDLTAGSVQALEVTGLDGYLLPGDEISLVYHFEDSSAAAEATTFGLGSTLNRYWSSTPFIEMPMEYLE